MKTEIYCEIMQELRNSEAGRSLNETYRWSTFRTDEDNQSWSEMLGATANDLTHGQLMYGVAKSFLEHERGRFSQEQEETFLYGILCHDWGEAIINGEGVGDVYALIKTGKEEVEEQKIVRRVIASLEIDDLEKEKLLNGYEQVVEGKDSELNLAFKALEKSEYVMTAIKVYLNGKRMREMGGLGIELETPMVARVLVINLASVLDKFVNVYPDSIGLYFQNQAPVIEEMFKQTQTWLDEAKSWDGKEVDHARLAVDFQRKWTAFREQV